MVQTFYPRKSILVCGAVCSVIFAIAIAGYSTLLFVEDAHAHGFTSNQHAAFMAYFGISLIGTMLLLSLVTIAEYWVIRCTCDKSHLTLHRLFRRVEIPLTSINRIEWSELSRPKAVVKYLGKTAKIKLSEYRDADQLTLIRLLRSSVGDDQQSGWPMFCYKVALPLRDGPVPRRPRPDEVLINRKRYDRLFAALLPTIAVISLICWLATRRVEVLAAALAIPIALSGFWLLLRSSVPKQGRYSEDLLKVSGGRLLLFTFGGCFGSLALMRLLQILEIPPRITWPIFLTWISLPLMSMLWTFPQLERRRRIENEAGSRLAPKLWGEGEAAETPLHNAPI